MEDVKVMSLEIDGNDYILIDKLEYDGKNYYCYVQENDNSDVQILKDLEENGELFLTSIDSESELDKVLSLFSEKYKK